MALEYFISKEFVLQTIAIFLPFHLEEKNCIFKDNLWGIQLWLIFYSWKFYILDALIVIH